MRQAIIEAILIAVTGTMLGLVYSASTETGLFARTGKPLPTADPIGGKAPAMISLEEAKQIFESGKAVFIDARHEFDYKLGHIKGAMNVPLKEFETHKQSVVVYPIDQLLVSYCDGADCNSSIELAAKLHAIGFINVKIFYGGWREWQDNRLPTEATPK